MICRKCGYALHGLSENRCPECGLPFDPADPTSFVSATARKSSPGAELGWMLFMHSVLVLMGSMILDGGYILMAILGAMGAFWLGVIWMALRCRGRLSNLHRRFIRYGAVPTIIVTAIFIYHVKYVWEIVP